MEEVKNKLKLETASLTPKLRLRAMILQVDTAIENIMSAQSYNIAGQSLTRANLNDLRLWRSQLQKELIGLKGPLRKMTTVNFNNNNS
ncbi:hypothetical protein REA38_11620 [Serratia sp. MF2]|uniref:hypothetical protein n=1 Tax=Serratia sp. MF1(2023) TaxID=3059171 RepID=UPI0027EFB3DC|nr:hypothetical protein [Serratia sp. MF1(2023)]MDQ7104198.1 hypothetical protein [Serratia sp. MF1(2023)]